MREHEKRRKRIKASKDMQKLDNLSSSAFCESIILCLTSTTQCVLISAYIQMLQQQQKKDEKKGKKVIILLLPYISRLFSFVGTFGFEDPASDFLIYFFKNLNFNVFS